MIVAWATVSSTGWKLLIVVPTDSIFKPSMALSAHLNTITELMISGMLVFYSIFFTILYRQSKKMSVTLAEPLKEMSNIVSDIAAGRHISSYHDFFVTELHSTASGILDMGTQLESANRARELASAELNKRTEQLQIVFDVSPIGYLLVNTQHEILLTNNIISVMTGLSMPELLAMPEEKFWAHLSGQTKEPLTLIENTDKLQRIDLIKPRRVSLLCGMREIYLPNGDVLGKLYFLHDITKEEESNRIKSDFLTNATHELRTPLATIHGYSELLNSGMIPADMQPDIIDMIYQQSTWLITMINELLDLSRIEERAGADFVIESFPLADLIQQTIADFAIPEGRAAVIYVPMEVTINVKMDKNKFKQALLNIIDNAYKYSPNGGDVAINVHLDVTQNTVDIEVRDSGLGLTEDEIAHVFERFFRVDKSGNVPGVGLGLSLSKEIINLFNGDIHISSVPNQGSSVFISLSLD